DVETVLGREPVKSQGPGVGERANRCNFSGSCGIRVVRSYELECVLPAGPAAVGVLCDYLENVSVSNLLALAGCDSVEVMPASFSCKNTALDDGSSTRNLAGVRGVGYEPRV